MSWMFNHCKSLISLPDISNWNTFKVIDMKYMFQECNSLISLPDILKWITSKAKNKNTIFNNSFNILNKISP